MIPPHHRNTPTVRASFQRLTATIEAVIHQQPGDAAAATAALLLMNLGAVYRGVRIAAEVWTVTTMLVRATGLTSAPEAHRTDRPAVVAPDGAGTSARAPGQASNIEYVIAG